MYREQQIENLKKEKLELENKISGIDLSDADTDVLSDKLAQIDAALDEMIGINAAIAKRKAQSNVSYDQEMLTRLASNDGTDMKDDKEMLRWWLSRY